MNPTPEEKMSDYLADIDSDLLDAAMSADTQEKLDQHKKTKAIPFYKKPAFLRTVAAAACLLLMVNIVSLFRPEPATQETEPPVFYPPVSHPPVQQSPNASKPSTPFVDVAPWENMNAGELNIESVDMINYYAAIRFLTPENGATATACGTGYQAHFLRHSPSLGELIVLPPDATFPENTNPPDIMVPPPALDTTEPPRDTEGPPLQPPTAPTLPQDPDWGIVYYEIDPEETFYMSSVSFFRIEVSGDGLLARKIGTGIVDVVISDAIWGEQMITFKNGDKYYSCLTNGGGPMHLEFSTHKYIEGYNVVKNGRQENTYFNVSIGLDGQIQQFEEGDYQRSIFPVLGKTYVAQVDACFTIADLENYFRELPQPATV